MSVVRRRLERLLELNWPSSGSPRPLDDLRELDFSEEDRVGLVRFSHDDSEERRERWRRDAEVVEARTWMGSAWTATEHILLAEDFLLLAAASSRIVSIGRLDLGFGRHSLFNRIPDSLISITDWK